MNWPAFAGPALVAAVAGALAVTAPPPPPTSYSPVVMPETFEAVRDRLVAAKPRTLAAQMALLRARYDLADRPLEGAAMTRGKRIQGGVRVRLAPGLTWEALATKPPAEIKAQGLWPEGFLPLPHPDHPQGGQLFPGNQIRELLAQEGRDLTRFDLDLDLPETFLPEFPPAIFLTTRPDLGDVSRGQVVTLANHFELFNGILNPKQLEGLRLLLTPFPQQQFNATDDRRSLKPSQGVACFDCHTNGHTNGATHLSQDTRPTPFRHRLDTPTLRGAAVMQLFGSQRALKSVEDFTEFEQRAAYFDGDPVLATKKGVNVLDRGSQVHFMGEFQNILDFPPAPKLGVDGHLDPRLATPQELRGQALFFGRANCGSCHPAPYYTDNLMHDLRTDRFFKPRMVRGAMAGPDGRRKTFPLRGIKDSPPYLHDGRLLTLDDTVAFFSLVTGVSLSAREREDLVRFLLQL